MVPRMLGFRRLGAYAIRAFRGLKGSPGILWGLLGGVGGRAFTFLAGVILALILPPSEFSVFAALHLTAFTVATVFSSGIALTLNTTAASGGSRRGVYAVGFFTLGAPSVVGLLLFPWLLGWLSPETADGGVPFLVAMAPGSLALASATLSLLAGRGQVRRAAGYETARGVAGAAGQIVGGIVGGAEGAVATWAAVELIFGLAQLVSYRDPERDEARRLAAPDYSLAGAGIVSTALVQVSLYAVQIGVARLYGAEAFAAYALALRLANFVLLPPNFLARNTLGELKRNSYEETAWKRPLRRHLKATIGLTLCTVLIVVFISFIGLGETLQDYDAQAMLLVLLLMSVIRVASNTLGIAGLSQGRTARWFVSDLVGAVISLALAYLLFQIEIPSAELFVAGTLGVAALTTMCARLTEVRYRPSPQPLRRASPRTMTGEGRPRAEPQDEGDR